MKDRKKAEIRFRGALSRKTKSVEMQGTEQALGGFLLGELVDESVR